ncbi:MAG: hypothetical protein HQK50_08490 [Oligoflexia bacterium]|nr:hypothetical protein [Oligoflexia bacterium]MBF0365596.1 hypothetical protein [Oligoflexia bacterium]
MSRINVQSVTKKIIVMIFLFMFCMISLVSTLFATEDLACSSPNMSLKSCLLVLQRELADSKRKILELEQSRAAQQELSALKTFTIGGDSQYYYPVWFADNCWHEGETKLVISRASIHTNGEWAGSVNIRFVYHSFACGHGSSFLDAAIEYTNAGTSANRGPFIANFDSTNGCSAGGIVVWLRGGGLTYNYKSSCTVSPVFSTTEPITIPGSNVLREKTDKIDAKVTSIMGMGLQHIH